MSHVVAADHDDEVAIARGASWELAPTPRVGPARKTSCRTCLWSLIALDGLPERASEAKIAFAQLFSLLNFGAGVHGMTCDSRLVMSYLSYFELCLPFTT